MNKDWIEQADVWRRRYAPLTWIPLYLSRDRGEGQYGYEGYFTDIEAVRTVAVYEEHRAELDGVGFVDLPHCHGPNTWRGYSACDVYLSRDGKDVGAHIALHQSFDGDHPSLLSLNQDFVFALQLIREGDVWVRPGEGYAEVAKIERRADGVAEALLVRPEFLKDYLAARSMSLFIGSYRERRWIVPSLSSLPYKEDHDHDEVDQFGRHSFHVRPISVGGFPYGGGVAVFTAARNDRWADDEIPVLGPETEENVVSTSSTFRREGKKLFCITSERRSSEWLEPASTSQRVRHDDVPSRSYFLVDSQGASSNADELNREEIGLWLYFRPSVVPDILSRRGASIDWHTRFTASDLS